MMDERRYAAQYKYRYYDTGYSNIGSVSLKVSISAEAVTNPLTPAEATIMPATFLAITRQSSSVWRVMAKIWLLTFPLLHFY